MLPGMTWRVERLDARVDKEIAALAEDVQARLIAIIRLIEAHGLPAVGLPHVKHLEGKLWEMRPRGRSGIARAIYVVATGERVVIVHAFAKKTQKTPPEALVVARRRAKEVR
jgi:phage-related protein